MRGRRSLNSAIPPYRATAVLRTVRNWLSGTTVNYALIEGHNARMKKTVICSLLFAALAAPALAAGQPSAMKMLEDAAVNHDLARIRFTWEHRVKDPHDFRTERNKPGSHAANVGPAAAH